MTDPAPDLAALREKARTLADAREHGTPSDVANAKRDLGYACMRHGRALLALVDTLQEALSEYGRHQEGCSAAFGYACKCGWTQESGRLLEGDALSVPPAEKEIGDDDSEGWCGVVARAALSVSPAAKKQP